MKVYQTDVLIEPEGADRNDVWDEYFHAATSPVFSTLANAIAWFQKKQEAAIEEHNADEGLDEDEILKDFELEFLVSEAGSFGTLWEVQETIAGEIYRIWELTIDQEPAEL